MDDLPARSREHLLHMLAEASELEHNLLCSYLFAAFSLKTGQDEDLTPAELDGVTRWRQSILRVCMEEMSHLAQVANLMVSLGSRPHFDRPNLPISPGYHPARIRIALAPFDLDTLNHFIYLERPETSRLVDSWQHPAYERRPEYGVLMPSAPDYETIGEFYGILSSSIRQLADEIGEARLFIGPVDCQMRPEEIGAADLSVVRDVASAVRALDLIVEQGEGAPSHAETSHFEAFGAIKREFEALSAARPAFRPTRPVARNPAMRRPIGDDRVHVTATAAAGVLDAANAIYALMLRCMTAVYDTPSSQPARRQALLAAAIGLMKTLAEVSDVLTRLPANDAATVNAGVTFAMLRSTEGLAPGVDVAEVLGQRFDRIRSQLPRLAMPASRAAAIAERLGALREALAGTS